jgi:hypothetical protein
MDFNLVTNLRKLNEGLFKPITQKDKADRKMSGPKLNAQFLYDEGEIIDSWAIDEDEDGNLESNGGVQYLIAYNNDYYLISSGNEEGSIRGGYEFIDRVKELKDDDFGKSDVIREYEKQLFRR